MREDDRFAPFPSPRQISAFVCWLACMVVALSIGGKSSAQSTRPVYQRTDGESAQQARSVIAQGRLLPATGIVEIALPPGDVVDEVLVQPGDKVERGQPLLRLRSEAAQELNIEALEAAVEAAKVAHQQALATAVQQLAAARRELARQRQLADNVQRREQLIAMAQRRVDIARESLARMEELAEDESLRGFVDEREVLKQRLTVQEAEADLLEGKLSYEEAKAAAKLAVEAAAEQVDAAEKLLELTENDAAVRRLEAELKAARVAWQNARVLSPVNGTVLAVDIDPGEATTGVPVLACANLDAMICELEVNTIDAALVQPGQRVEMRSPALGRQILVGTVTKKLPLVGTPLLKPLDPRSRVDFRAVTAIVKLDEDSSRMAAQWVRLQVEATIMVGAQ